MKITQIPRINRPSVDKFYRDYVNQGRPVVVTGSMDSWPALSSWSSDDYLTRVGSSIVPVESFDPNGRTRTERMSVADYISRIQKSDGAQDAYLSEVLLKVAFPELVDDVRPSAYRPDADPGNLAFMMGRQTYAPMHFHPTNEAISAQVVGTKEFILIEPKFTSLLKPLPFYSPYFNFSKIDFKNGWLGPLTDTSISSDLEVWEVTLNPGEFIYIPVNWWHVVYGGDDLNILLVDFFSASLKRLHYPSPGIQSIIQDMVRRYAPNSLLDLIEKMYSSRDPS